MAGVAENDAEQTDIVMGGTEEYRALVVVDGPNVAVGEGSKEKPNLGAVEAAVKSLRSQNHKSFAILPRYFEKYVASDLLEKLKKEEVVVIVPSQAHDDHFMLTYAKDHQPAFVLSNDMFRDHYTMYGEEWVKQTVIPFSFIGKKCIPAPEGIERAVRSGEAHPEAFGTGNGSEDDGAESSEAGMARASPMQPEPKRKLPQQFDDPENIDWLADDFDGVGMGADGVWDRSDSDEDEDEDEDGDSFDEGEHEQAAAHGGEGSSPMEDADSDHELDVGPTDRPDGAAWRPASSAPAGAGGPARGADPGPAASHAPMRDDDEGDDGDEEGHGSTRSHQRVPHRQSRDDHGNRRRGQDRQGGGKGREGGRGRGGGGRGRGRGKGGGQVRDLPAHGHGHSHGGGSSRPDPLLAAAAKAVSSQPVGLASGRWKKGGTMAPRVASVRAGAAGGGLGGSIGRGRGRGTGRHPGGSDRPVDRRGDGGRDRGGRRGSTGKGRGEGASGPALMVELAEGKPSHHGGRSRAGSHHSKGSGHGGRRPRIQSGDSLGSRAGAKDGKHHGSKSKGGGKSGKSGGDAADAEVAQPADIRDLSKVSTVVHLSSRGSSSPLPDGPIDESKLSLKERLALQRKRKQQMEEAKASGAAPMQQQSPGKPNEFHVSSRTEGPGIVAAGASALASSSSSGTSASRADARAGGDARAGIVGRRPSKQMGGRTQKARQGGGKNPGGGGRALEGGGKTRGGGKRDTGPKHESKASEDGAAKGRGTGEQLENVVKPAALRDMSGVSTVVHLSSAAASATPASARVGEKAQLSYVARLNQRQQRLQEARAKGAT